MSHSSWVQVLVNAKGKKASRTRLPRKAESVTSFPEVDGKVKSGAGEPTGGGDDGTGKSEEDGRRLASAAV